MTENIKFVSISMRDGTKLSGVGRLEETPFAVTIYDDDDGSYTVVPMQAISYYDVYDSEEEDE